MPSTKDCFYKKISCLGFGFFFVLACLSCDSPLTSSDASYIFTWGSLGTKPGQFTKPRGIAFSPRNEVYVVDMTGRIQAFDPQGKYLRSFRTPEIAKGKPTGLGFSPQGLLFVADTHYHRILCYNKEGNLLFQFGQYGTQSNEFVYVTDVAVSQDGLLYAAQYGDALGEYDRIMKFDSQGRFIHAWGKRGTKTGEFERPMSLVVEKTGNILVADSCNHRIQRFSPDGKFLTSWGTPGVGIGEMSYPYGIDVDKDGFIYVSEFGNNRIQKFTSQGQSLGCFGIPGRLPGMFANPWNVSVGSDGFIYATDALNHRVQKISPTVFP